MNSHSGSLCRRREAKKPISESCWLCILAFPYLVPLHAQRESPSPDRAR